MSFNSLEKFIELAKKEGVSSLKYENEDEKFEVAFPFASGELVAPSRSHLTHTPSVSSPAPLKEAGSDAHIIKSPFVGTFYSSSSPGEAAFVKVGDKVASGTVLCILEAMKIMNEIEADVSGEVLEVCVENESLVEYGQPLFKIKK